MRPILAAAASLLIATAFACSPSDRSGGAVGVGAPDSGSPDAGIPDAGAGGSGSPPDAGGPPASGGAPDGGAGSGGDGGEGTPDAGGGSGGGGSDGGTVASECDSIVPTSLGDSFSATVTPSDSATCSFAASDYSGNVALESHQSFHQLDWSTFSSSGSPLGRIQSTRTLIPGVAGFEGVAKWTGEGSPMDSWHVWAWGPDGSVKSSSSVGSISCAGIPPTTSFCPTGGAVVFTACDSGEFIELYRVDDNANVLWRRDFNADASGTVACDDNGNILVVYHPPFPASPLAGFWFDGSGNRLGNPFNIPETTGIGLFTVHNLIGGGAAVMEGEVWRAVLPSGGLPQAAPDWLASRTGTNIAIVRGARAYAFTSRAGASTVELVSPAGNSCGSIDVGGANVIVGGDGTVFTQTGDNGCRRTWYPALLR